MHFSVFPAFYILVYIRAEPLAVQLFTLFLWSPLIAWMRVWESATEMEERKRERERAVERQRQRVCVCGRERERELPPNALASNARLSELCGDTFLRSGLFSTLSPATFPRIRLALSLFPPVRLSLSQFARERPRLYPIAIALRTS